MRRALLAAGVTLVLTACSGGDGPGEAAPTGDPEAWRTDPAEPYPFTLPVPRREPTPVDGTYGRNHRQGSDPIPCARCAPYRLDRGQATLRLDAGRFEIEHPGSRFRSVGHYVVEGDRLVLFNDPNCPEVRGTYRWAANGDTLSLDAVDDPCAFDLLRARYFSASPWTAA
jgi:hypothetical protein